MLDNVIRFTRVSRLAIFLRLNLFMLQMSRKISIGVSWVPCRCKSPTNRSMSGSIGFLMLPCQFSMLSQSWDSRLQSETGSTYAFHANTDIRTRRLNCHYIFACFDGNNVCALHVCWWTFIGLSAQERRSTCRPRRKKWWQRRQPKARNRGMMESRNACSFSKWNAFSRFCCEPVMTDECKEIYEQLL